MTSSDSLCMAPWPTRGGWIRMSIRTKRTPGTCYLGDPQVVNMSPVGLARFSTLRSWLSQWSYDEAHGDGVDCGRDIAVPALVIGNLADDACTPSPHPTSFRGNRSSRQGDARNPGRHALLRRPRISGTSCVRPSTPSTDWLVRRDFRGNAMTPPNGPLDGIRVARAGPP